ncbi:acyl-CoA synthetase (NDP forming) [Frankia casuarinae]|uniref:GCN5-related N-acetyltransferase n=2 Tax=Frankia casuarinae (strain DSM 45818 / CECT 9043 / HFP020203 / CcI3) TaxID=106370 RepID=Q2J787_FRACC|nr:MULTISPECIES: bifunctional GNAT family N-acetyltransferase/acetate--CoA ligase family protein [Frankia]ABD12855.1 GCN5-related N-acetyltransferase [Frankia casuarinae]ETA03312.1 acyl-CoA synthetase (NDP forming) [Frankia sp. CcI6]EYT92704.1 acyl-CoA synthetase (NDP forming) [Frankia casuarinae]KDA43639.1 acyl-CoA synthetase (NDP forming) [Frankia sp. BMG5.23]KEZ36947.1 acyl-CoA synthetase (NDP forming) [Frankia sp. CeD]
MSTEPPVVYPAEWEADVILSDGGTAHIRPILPTDGPLLRTFWTRLSTQSIYFRFFAVRRALSDADIHRMTTVDQRLRGAIVAMIGDDLVAVSHWESTAARPTEAEVAFLVEDAQQGRGLGSVLLEHLAAAAWDRGIRRFDADVLGENQQMIRVFLDAGYTVSRTWDSGAVRLSFEITPTQKSVGVMRAREHHAEAASIGRLLHPRAIAVIGAGRSAASVGNAVLRHLLAGGFDGPVYPVNPAAAAAGGAVASIQAYAGIEDVPRPVDLAVVCVPPAQVPDVVAACGRAGVWGLVVLTDQRDAAADAALVAEARADGMRVVGPASMGIQNPAAGLNASMVPRMPPAGRIGCYSQSGPFGGAILAAAAARGVGLSVFVSAGDRADVSGNDLLQYWEEDPETDAVIMHLETFGNPRKFARLARRVGRRKPVIVVYSGRSTLDDALLRQAGVIGVDQVSQAFDVALLLTTQPLPAGGRVAVVGDSRALVRLTARAADAAGLRVEEVLLPVGSSPGDLTRALTSAADRADALIATLVRLPPSPAGPIAVDAVAAAATIEIPVLAAVQGVEMPGELAGIPAYSSPEAAVAALRRVVGYAQWWARPIGTVPTTTVRADEARSLVAGLTGRLPEDRAAALLDCYGVTVEPAVLVTSPRRAVEAAGQRGYPVALKARSRPYRHRPDLRGQRLDLPDAAAVRAAWASLRSQLGAEVPIVVQRMAPVGVSVVVGSEEHPRYGPLVSFGLSGPATELLEDRAHHILPLTDVDAARLVRSVRAAPLLLGYLGSTPVDIAALEDLLLKIARLADDVPEVVHLTLDPVIVSTGRVTVLSVEIVAGPSAPRADVGPRRFWTPNHPTPDGATIRGGSAQHAHAVHNRLP